MTFVFEPPGSLLIVPLVILAAGVLGALVVRRRNPLVKALRLAAAVVLAVVLLLRYHDSEVVVDDSGIAADTRGEPRIAWSEVTAARYVADLRAAGYMPQPDLRSAFGVIGYGSARYGQFDLAGGRQAQFAVQTLRQPAVVLDARNQTFVFSPLDVQGFAAAVARHVALAGLEAR